MTSPIMLRLARVSCGMKWPHFETAFGNKKTRRVRKSDHGARETLCAGYNCFIALSSAAINGAMEASVSSPMLEIRKVVPLIFP